MSYDISIKGKIDCDKVVKWVNKHPNIKGEFPSYYLHTEMQFMNIDVERVDEEGTSIGGVKENGVADCILFHIPYSYWEIEVQREWELGDHQYQYIEMIVDLAYLLDLPAYDEQMGMYIE